MLRWKEGTKEKVPPRARRKKPATYPSNGREEAKDMEREPAKSKTLEMRPQNLGPKRSRREPTMRADRLVATEAMMKLRLSLDQ